VASKSQVTTCGLAATFAAAHSPKHDFVCNDFVT
jgi:hypothetical protein